ncbi:sodium/phosphate symporter [Haladaptatus sp. CMAA 1911]|uniref:sodium/phosphate symporter n=1 Tax=unclassified Haladaptatus TaxID=2622732 RepID=UPI0037542ADA
MDNRRPYILVGITVFMAAVAMRMIPLYWSYLPFNLDGFQFAAPARYTLAHGHLPTSASYFQPDKYTFSALLTICSQLTGISPIRIAQPLIAVIGSVPCLIAVWITRRIGLELGWQPGQTRIAAALTGLVLATEGIYLGRSAAVTSEGAGIVFVAVIAFVFYRMIQTGRPSWIVLTVLLVIIFPLTHSLSTMIGALVITSLLAGSLRRSISRVGILGAMVVVGFWAYLGSYYSIMELGDVSRVSSVPGLFFAWIIVLITASVGLPTTSVRSQRAVSMFILVGGVGVVVANFFVPVFPGTAELQTMALLLVIPIAVGGFVATYGLPYITTTRDGAVVLALVLGPLTLIGFALTADLTVEYQDIIARSQIFAHFGAIVLASLAVVGLGIRGRVTNRILRVTRTGLIPLLLVIALVSAPLAFAGLRATPAQPVTEPNEFETTTFAATYIPSTWVSDGHITRLASYYYPSQTNSTYTPLYQWLRGGGEPPKCTVVSQQSWTTVGAQLFPASPIQLDKNQYRSWLESKQVIYSASGEDPVVISRPSGVTPAICHP